MSPVDDLARLPLFRSVAREDLEDLCRVASLVELAAGAVVFAQGARADVALLLLTGRLVATVATRGGGPTVLGPIEPGEVVGEQALLQPERPRLATVTAAEPSTALVLSPDLLELVSRNGAW